MRSEAGSPLYLDQQLRRSEQLHLVQSPPADHRGIARLCRHAWLHATRCTAAGEIGPSGPHERQLNGKALEYEVDMGSMGEHVGMGDRSRLADRCGDDVEHDELSTRPGISPLPCLPDMGWHDHQREREMG